MPDVPADVHAAARTIRVTLKLYATLMQFLPETNRKAHAIELTVPEEATLDDVIASRGGIPLVEGGKLIGAIGCSGGTGSQDETICTAGANTVNK